MLFVPALACALPGVVTQTPPARPPTEVPAATLTSTSLPTPTALPTATPVPTLDPRIGLVYNQIDAIINEPDYERGENFLHLYQDFLTIEIRDDVLTFRLDLELPRNEAVLIAADYIVVGILVSRPGEEGDWMLTRIETTFEPGRTQVARYYVEGHEALAELNAGQTTIWEVMGREYN